jgi:hypothetical protein
MELSNELGDSEIPLDVIHDLWDKNGELSVWLVDDLGVSLHRVAAALQKDKEQPSGVTFRVLETGSISELGIHPPTKSIGISADKRLNQNTHFWFPVRTCAQAMKLARAFARHEQKVVSQKVVADQIIASIKANNIDPKTLRKDLCQWLFINHGSSPIAKTESETVG